MGDEYQAETAIRYLSGATLYGKRLNVVYSKHSSVEMPREDTAGLTKDYTDSKLNRFFKPGSKNFQNIFPPSATLHLSNIGVEISDEAMIKLFTDRGLTVEAFRFFVKDKRMALIRLASVEEGMKGLIEMHNHELDKGHHLRVSFTKSTIQD
jgi:hnRNP-L/PTB/hephaestus splicing factor